MTNKYDPNHAHFTKALDELSPELEKMTDEQVVPIRHDIMSSIILVLGTIPNLRRARKRVVARFGEVAAQHFDRLETAARACGRAHAKHLATLHGADVEEMAGRLSQIRTVLLFEVQALIDAKKLPGTVVAELIGGTSYRGLCLDVLQLIAVLRDAWTDLDAHTSLQSREIDEAEELANAFSTALGENEVSLVATPTAETRRRAYSMFVRTYSQVRRYVTYVYWKEGDADAIAPPLGSARRATTPDTDTTPVTNGAPVVPAPSPNAPIAPTGNG